MFQYTLALLLVTYCSSSVLPMQKQSANGSVASLMINLANDCPNTFIKTQINARMNECNQSVPSYSEKGFECLIFYDINRQLCDAVRESRLVLTEDYTAAINEPTNVEDLCKLAKDWKFGKIDNFIDYEHTVAKVFNAKFSCVKVCGVEDVISQDVNFYCKYYKWGSHMLSNLTKPTEGLEVSSNVEISNNSAGKAPESDPKKVSDPSVGVALPDKYEPVQTGIVPEGIPEDNEAIKKQEESNVLSQTPGKPVEFNSITQTENGKASNIKSKVLISEAPASASAPVNSEPNNNGMDEPSAVETELETPKKTEDGNKEENVLDTKQENQIVATGVKDKIDASDDYQDGDDQREGLPDGVDDGDDPGLGETDTKMDAQTKNTKKIERPMSFPADKEFYPNLQDGFSDDDDHFFPFFLTAIILVILIYVLYHNKSKVSKVFLGLIVEGRQPGRRRNSRGHAYRRLDTLEQAMSSNSTAPPSKIIY